MPEVVAQKERLASLGQASLEFVHANNPIPEVACVDVPEWIEFCRAC